MEPLTLEEVRDHLQIDHEDEDAWLDAKLAEARQKVEDACGKSCLTQTRRLKLLDWPCSGIITLPRGPVASVSSITYLDTNGDSQTWSSGDYQVDTAAQPPTIVPVYGESFPSIRTQDGVYVVTITYVAGYTARGHEDLQQPRQAMLELIRLWWENRTGLIQFGTATPLVELEAGILAKLVNFTDVTEYDRAFA